MTFPQVLVYKRRYRLKILTIRKTLDALVNNKAIEFIMKASFTLRLIMDTPIGFPKYCQLSDPIRNIRTH